MEECVRGDYVRKAKTMALPNNETKLPNSRQPRMLQKPSTRRRRRCRRHSLFTQSHHSHFHCILRVLIPEFTTLPLTSLSIPQHYFRNFTLFFLSNNNPVRGSFNSARVDSIGLLRRQAPMTTSALNLISSLFNSRVSDPLLLPFLSTILVSFSYIQWCSFWIPISRCFPINRR